MHPPVDGIGALFKSRARNWRSFILIIAISVPFPCQPPLEAHISDSVCRLSSSDLYAMAASYRGPPQHIEPEELKHCWTPPTEIEAEELQ